MKKIGITFLLILVGIFQTITGQNIEQEPQADSKKINLIEVAISFANPQKSFKQRYGKSLTGFETCYLRQLKKDQPIFLYGKFDYYPMEAHEIIDVNGATDRTSAHLIGLELGARYYLPIKISALEFYGEIGLGNNNLYSLYSVTQEDESLLSTKLLGDSALKYATSVGMNIKAGFGYLFVKSGYQNGLSARYMKKTDDLFTSFKTSDLAFFKTKSSIDVIKWDIGYTFVF